MKLLFSTKDLIIPSGFSLAVIVYSHFLHSMMLYIHKSVPLFVDVTVYVLQICIVVHCLSFIIHNIRFLQFAVTVCSQNCASDYFHLSFLRVTVT